MRKYLFLSILFLLLAGISELPAQKIEIERRVDKEVLPDRMLDYLDRHYDDTRRNRYYLEQNEEGKFYEAKFKYRRSRYSVKFRIDGSLYDVERQVKYKELPEATKDHVEKALSDRLRRWRVVKVQERLEKGQVMGYEIEIKGKSSDHLGYFEAQFDREGRLQDLQTVEQRSNDFLFF